jgi:heme A synthase
VAIAARLAAPVPRPSQGSVRGFALASVIANAVLICTGAAVRLSSSGLGCPDWPRCTKASVVAAHSAGQTTLNTWIECGNRLLNFPLEAPAGLVWVHVAMSVLLWILALRLFLSTRERGPAQPEPQGSDVYANSVV